MADENPRMGWNPKEPEHPLEDFNFIVVVKNGDTRELKYTPFRDLVQALGYVKTSLPRNTAWRIIGG